MQLIRYLIALQLAGSPESRLFLTLILQIRYHLECITRREWKFERVTSV